MNLSTLPTWAQIAIYGAGLGVLIDIVVRDAYERTDRTMHPLVLALINSVCIGALFALMWARSAR